MKTTIVEYSNDKEKPGIRKIQRGSDGMIIYVGMVTDAGRVITIEKDDDFTGGFKIGLETVGAKSWWGVTMITLPEVEDKPGY